MQGPEHPMCWKLCWEDGAPLVSGPACPAALLLEALSLPCWPAVETSEASRVQPGSELEPQGSPDRRWWHVSLTVDSTNIQAASSPLGLS